MRKTLASVLLCSSLITPACSTKDASPGAKQAGLTATGEVALDQPSRTEKDGAPRPLQEGAMGSASGAGVPAAAPVTGAAYGTGTLSQQLAPTVTRGDTTGGETYKDHGKNPWTDTTKDHLSTFAADVDTAAYTIARRKLSEGQLPPPAAVRVEEFVNYFRYAFPAPTAGTPFAVVMDAAPSPVAPGKHIVRVGVATQATIASERKPAHLVFLVDVSGSMQSPDKLELAKQALRILTNNLQEKDTVSLVTYAGSTRVVLEPTGLQHKAQIMSALDELTAGGSTAMASGLDLAYAQAMKGFQPGGIARVIVLSDGDANVGNTSVDDMLATIASRAKQGVTLSTIGFGMGNYKDETMEQLANKGNGNNFYIDSLAAAKKVFAQQLGSTLEVVAKDAKFQVDFDPAFVARYRLVGYENRDIADTDFRNDKVDAGEIGAGHQVTALYEVELTAAGKQAAAPLGSVRIRHKAPMSETATEAAFPMVGAPAATFAQASADFRFAFATAAFADVLRHSTDAEHWSLAQIRDLAKGAIGQDAERRELVTLIETTMRLTGRTAQR